MGGGAGEGRAIAAVEYGNICTKLIAAMAHNCERIRNIQVRPFAVLIYTSE